MVDNSAAKSRLNTINEALDRRTNIAELDSLITKTSLDLCSCLSDNTLYVDDMIITKLQEVYDRLNDMWGGSLYEYCTQRMAELDAAITDVSTKAKDKPPLQKERADYLRIRTTIGARKTNYEKLLENSNKFKNDNLENFDFNITLPTPRVAGTVKIDLDSKFMRIGWTTVDDYVLCDKDWNKLTSTPNVSWWKDYKINIWWRECTLVDVRIVWGAWAKQLDCSHMTINPPLSDFPQTIDLSINGVFNALTVSAWDINVAYNKKFQLKLNDWGSLLVNHGDREDTFDEYNRWWVWWTATVIEDYLTTELDEEQKWWKQKLQRDAIEKALRHNWWTLYDTLSDSQKAQFLQEMLNDINIINFDNIRRIYLKYNMFRTWFAADARSRNKDNNVIKSQWKYKAFIHNNLPGKINEFISGVLDKMLQEDSKNTELKWRLTEFMENIEDNKLDNGLNKRISSKIRSKKNQKLYEMERGPRSPFHNRDANYMRFFSWSSTELSNQTVNIYTKLWEAEPVNYDLKMNISWKNNIDVEIKLDWKKDPIHLSSGEPTALVRRVLREQQIKYWKVRAHIWYSIYKAMIQLAKEKYFSLQYREKDWTRFIDLDWDNIVVRRVKNLTTESTEEDILTFNQEKFENTNEFGWAMNYSLEKWLLEIWKHFNYAMNHIHKQYRRWVEKRFGTLVNSKNRMRLPRSFWLSPIKKILNMKNTTNFEFETTVESNWKIIDISFAKNKFTFDMEWLEKPIESKDLWKILNKRQNKTRIFDWMERDIVEWIYVALVNSLRENAKIANTDFWVKDDITWNMFVLNKDGRFGMIPKEDLNSKIGAWNPMTWIGRINILWVPINWRRNRKKFWVLNKQRLDRSSMTLFEQWSAEEKELLRNPFLMQRLIKAMNRRMWLFENVRAIFVN